MDDFFGESTERVKMMRKRALEAQPVLSSERAKIITESYREHEAMPIHLKRAYALKDILRQMKIYIADGELIVGNHAEGIKYTPVFPEYIFSWVIEELDEIEVRPGDRFIVPQCVKEELRALEPYWKGKTLSDRADAIMPEETNKLVESGVIKAPGNVLCGDAHLAIHYPKLFTMGVEGYLKEVEKSKASLDLSDYRDLQKLPFLDACEVALNAIISFSDRFSMLAARMAAEEKNETRAEELRKVSVICAQVPRYAPKSFHEGLQAAYFMQLVFQIESNGHSVSFGRFDQFLYPLYRHDIESGVLTSDQADELLECMWIKLNELVKIRPWMSSRYNAGYPMYQNVTIGGQLPNGGNAENELSYAVLRTVGRIKLTQPNLTVRYHKGMADDFFARCIDVVKKGFGMPAFNNDEAIIPSLIRYGVDRQDASNYSAIGCVEVNVPGKWGYRVTGMSFMNFLQLFNAVLRGGYDEVSGIQLYPQKTKTLAEMNSFDELWALWEKYIAYFTRQSVILDSTVDLAHEAMLSDVALSAFVDDCIARGKGLKEGGAHYDIISGLQIGIANVGNAMAAVKKLVFEEKRLTAEQLMYALDTNFSGTDGERIRQLLLNGSPKYGQDDGYADTFLTQAYQVYLDEIRKYHNTRYGRGPLGGGYFGGTSTVSANVPAGADVGASADGRFAFSALAEGASPSAGTDRFGPTAVFRSIAKLPWREITGGVLLNQKMAPMSIKKESDVLKMISAIRTFFDDLKGFHVQYNIVDRSTLIDAQAHPENYRDLIVRVAGYSACFTALDTAMQNNIIERTEHSF